MITRHTSDLFGRATEQYSCACGWWSHVYFVGAEPSDTDPIKADVREHLADDHSDQLDVGRCEKCGQPTEHFRAVTPHGTLYLCEAHSPAMSDLDVRVPAPPAGVKLGPSFPVPES